MALSLESNLGIAIRESRLIAVVVLDDPERATPLAEALLTGGIRVMELTLRTPGALEAVRRICRQCPDLLVGAGTVLEKEQLAAVVDAGAHFAVSPGTNPEILKAAEAIGLPFGPGVMTPSDVDLARSHGCELLKFFPATSSGGLQHLNNIAAPFAHLGLQYIPLGGISADNCSAWLDSPHVAAVGGSWLAPRDLIEAGDFAAIRERAAQATARVTQR